MARGERRLHRTERRGRPACMPEKAIKKARRQRPRGGNEKAPKSPDFIGFSTLQMAHLAGFEPTACRLGVSFRRKLTIGFCVMQWQKPQ